MEPAGYLNLIIQLGSFGLVAIGVLTVMQKTLPAFLEAIHKQAETFKAELARERESHEKSVDRITEAIEAQNRLLVFILGRGKPLTDEERQAIGI